MEQCTRDTSSVVLVVDRKKLEVGLYALKTLQNKETEVPRLIMINCQVQIKILHCLTTMLLLVFHAEKAAKLTNHILNILMNYSLHFTEIQPNGL